MLNLLCSSLVVLDTCLTQIVYLSIATVARSHPGLELRIIILTTVSFIVPHTDPRFLYILIKFKLQSSDADLYSHCIISSHIWLVIGNSRYDCFRLNFGICILYDRSLNCRSRDANRLRRLRLCTGSHV